MTGVFITGVGGVGHCFRDKDPVKILGARGLRYRDEATCFGMAAAKLALEDAGDSSGTTGVIVSSNLGNLDTVCRVSSAIHSPRRIFRSPSDLPNASSNVIASSIAIRFALRGPNIMICNGATSGLDALRWAEIILAANRAKRIVVVGVEVLNRVTRYFSHLRGPRGLFHGAASVVLEGTGSNPKGSYGFIDGHATGSCLSSLTRNIKIERWFAPDDGRPESPPMSLQNVQCIDLSSVLGTASGALGVLQTVAAVKKKGTSLLTTGGNEAPFARCLVTSQLTENSGVNA